MSDYEKAIRFATIAHGGQLDKAGRPYILHPIRVAETVEDPTMRGSIARKKEFVRIAAVLHDVVEDTSISLEEIEREFGPTVACEVDLLTKQPGQTYRDYLIRIRKSSIATNIKLADMADNSLPERVVHLDIHTQLRLAKKYTRGRHYLLTGEWHG